MKKFLTLLLTCAVLLPCVLFSGCNNGGGDIQFTNPVYDSGDPNNSKNPYPGFLLEYYSDDADKDQSQKKAVLITALNEIRDAITAAGFDVQALNSKDVKLSQFENGFVADITMEVEFADGKTTDRHVLGYFKTVQMPDGTYRTYFIYYNDINQNEKVDDKSKEELLDDVVSQIKPPAGNSGSGSKPSNSSSQSSSAQSSSQSSSQSGNESSKTNSNIDNISDAPDGISDTSADEI